MGIKVRSADETDVGKDAALSDWGKKLRLNRILGRHTRKPLVVAFDHALPLGPIRGTLNPAAQVEAFADAGVDGVLLTPGMARLCAQSLLHPNAPSLIMRLDWSSLWTSFGDAGKLRSEMLATPEQALISGADGVLTYLLIGTGDVEFEAREIARNSELARECERLGMPLIIESLARGKAAPDPTSPETLMLHTRIAAELGADLIKTESTDDPRSMAEVVKACPLPVMILGGARQRNDDDALEQLRGIVKAGAAGAFIGRNVFQAPDVRDFLDQACAVLGEEVEENVET